MKFIVGRHKRKLAESPPKARYVFRVRGKIVPLAKIQRWMERSEADNDEDAESETCEEKKLHRELPALIFAAMETPSDISYWEDDETAEGTPESGHSNEDHPSKNSKRKMIQQQIAEERNPYSEAVRGAMASLVRHRQPAVRDTPVASLQDLYNHTDLSTLLGSLEIDDVLVGTFILFQTVGTQIAYRPFHQARTLPTTARETLVSCTRPGLTSRTLQNKYSAQTWSWSYCSRITTTSPDLFTCFLTVLILSYLFWTKKTFCAASTRIGSRYPCTCRVLYSAFQRA